MGLNTAFAPLAPLERWICYTQTEIVNLRSDLIQYHQQFADYQKICQSQLDVLTQQVRQSHQTLTELQNSIIDLQNTQTEFARNIEDIYGKLISLSSQLHDRSVPETQTLPPPPVGGATHLPPEDASIQRSQCPAAQEYYGAVPSENTGQKSQHQWHRSSHYTKSRHLLIHMELQRIALRWIQWSMDLVWHPEH